MKRLLLLYYLLLLGINYAYSISDTVIHQYQQIEQPYPILVYSTDTHNLLIDDILTHKRSFTQSTMQTPNLGVSKKSHWVTFSLTNPTDEAIFIDIEYPPLDKVVCYTTINGKVFAVDSAGEEMPFKTRGNNFRNLVFNAGIQHNQTATYYLKIESGDQIILPIRILNANALNEKNASDNVLAGIYFGIILVMFLYNIFIFFSTREISYLHYVTYIFFVGFTQVVLSGYGFKYLWPDYPGFAIRSAPLFGALSGVATIVFIRNFLHTKEFAPRFNFLLHIFTLFYLASIVLCLIGEIPLSYMLVNLSAGPGCLILFFTGIYIYIKYKNRTALFFTIAWTVFLVSIVVFVLKDVGVIPYNTFTVLGLQIGSAFEVTLLSFALADKINIYRQEKEQAQLVALNAAQENERIIREQNVILEQKVEDRTIKLQHANEDLNTTLANLKEAQSQLVESEKMASLGQLTAGIAHEINNPINFVTSNVKPLKRDVDILIQFIQQLEKIAASEDLTENKQQQIEALKTEFDYTYLQEEIDYLLKGIREGSTRTAEIVKGLRIFSRVDEDDLKKADINEGLDSTLIIINNLLNGKIEVQRAYGTLPLVECYPGKLNQVFLNLISNAIYAIQSKFEGESGGIITIKTSLKESGILIQIADNGIGMNEATLKKLFEPFFTTKPVGEGTGLGLSISYNTIKKHHGNIHVESTLGVGTSFNIQIPIIHPNS